MDGFGRNLYTHTYTPTRCYLVSISHQTYHHLACVCVCLHQLMTKGGNVSFSIVSPSIGNIPEISSGIELQKENLWNVLHLRSLD